MRLIDVSLHDGLIAIVCLTNAILVNVCLALGLDTDTIAVSRA